VKFKGKEQNFSSNIKMMGDKH